VLTAITIKYSLTESAPAYLKTYPVLSPSQGQRALSHL